MKPLTSPAARLFSFAAASAVAALLVLIHAADLSSLGGQDVVARVTVPVVVAAGPGAAR